MLLSNQHCAASNCKARRTLPKALPLHTSSWQHSNDVHSKGDGPKKVLVYNWHGLT